MSPTIETFNFGDILLYSSFAEDDTHFIYLADTIEGNVYLAKILNREYSNGLVSRVENCNSDSLYNKISYIVLKTEHFRNLVAVLAATESNRDIYPQMTKCSELCDEDKEDLFTAIVEEDANVPPKLKELVIDLYE